MKKILFVLLCIFLQSASAQNILFNYNLDHFCKEAISQDSTISKQRKLTLDSVAQQLAHKKYIVFTCQTNSRRTHLLQIWAQTAFYYFGLYDKFAFSIGDSVTPINPNVAEVIKESGFYAYELATLPQGYMISLSREYQQIIISSKNELGTIKDDKTLVLNICFDGELSSVAKQFKSLNLPYQSPRGFENTDLEKQKYQELNKQIAIEMMYLASKVKVIEEAAKVK